MAKTLEQIEMELLTVTDQVGRLMDQVLQKNYVPAFRCGHSRLYLPGDYLKEWGRKYGIGLGPTPVSEVLDTEYEIDPPAITPAIRRIEQIMHPVRVSMAQVDFQMVPSNVLEGTESAILADLDPYMEARAPIVRARQLKNPQGRLHIMQAAWARERG